MSKKGIFLLLLYFGVQLGDAAVVVFATEGEGAAEKQKSESESTKASSSNDEAVMTNATEETKAKAGDVLNGEVFRRRWFNVKKKGLFYVAVKEYDVVAYFTVRKALKGKKKWSFTYKGLQYRFVSKQNMKMFQKFPQKYEPMYGGWCAYAIGKESKRVGIHPKSFLVEGGKLYLFYNRFPYNTLKMWQKEGSIKLQEQSDENWKAMETGWKQNFIQSSKATSKKINKMPQKKD